MKKCKWAGDVNDEYCKGCDGITMQVDGNSISCTECAGYEENEEDITTEGVDMTPTNADKQVVEDAAKHLNKNSDKIEDDMQSSKVENITNNVEETTQISTKDKKTNNNTSKSKKAKNEEKTKATTNKSEVNKVSEEHNFTESLSADGIRVTSIRYTSGATVKKGDNYFKFIAEEEWDVSRIEDVQEAREKLWAKLNAEVDSQIEELDNMN